MPSAEVTTVTIIGAGQAGLHAAQSLRKRGFEGVITLLGNEGYAPYQRPPLSKSFLKGQMEEARLSFKPEKFFVDQSIDCHFSAAVEEIDTANRSAQCADGSSYPYDRLIIATGSTPIALPVPGSSLDGVFVLRGLEDSKAIREYLGDASEMVVIGGGYIGLEVASAARQLGLEVTVIERLSRLLSRVTTPPISDFYHDLHREHGVNVLLDESVVEIEGEDKVTGVQLESGESIPAQLVLVGIGVRPNQQLAEAAGLDCSDGILVDMDCRTSDERVYGAGDCARTVVSDETSLRIESVHNALVQAERIAADIVGDDKPAFDPPWFWSDQYDIKLQTVGLFNDYTDIVIRGDVNEKKFSVLYLRDDELIAVDAINDPMSFMAGKQLFKKGIAVSQDEASDPDVNLKDLISKSAKRE